MALCLLFSIPASPRFHAGFAFPFVFMETNQGRRRGEGGTNLVRTGLLAFFLRDAVGRKSLFVEIILFIRFFWFTFARVTESNSIYREFYSGTMKEQVVRILTVHAFSKIFASVGVAGKGRMWF